MYSPSSSRSLIRFACSVVVLLGAAALGGRGAAAQQPDEALVSELARVLAAADARAFDPALFGEALRHPEPVVRRQAALAAGRIGDPAAVDALVEALGDSNQGVAAAAAFGLGLLKESRAVAPLLALVRSVPATSQGAPQTEAVTALARIGGDDGARALRELLGLGTTAGVATSAVQSAALLDAWRLGPRAPVPALIGYARDPDVTARWHALYSLARLRVARAVTTLLDALQDPQPMVRAVAVRGVSRALSDTAKLAPQDVVTRIRPLLADRDAGVRVNTLRALATFRDSAFAGQAAPLAADADLNVAVAAETTLGVLGGGRAVEALQPGLTSPVFALRRQAVIALAQADAAPGSRLSSPTPTAAWWRRRCKRSRTSSPRATRRSARAPASCSRTRMPPCAASPPTCSAATPPSPTWIASPRRTPAPPAIRSMTPGSPPCPRWARSRRRAPTAGSRSRRGSSPECRGRTTTWCAGSPPSGCPTRPTAGGPRRRSPPAGASRTTATWRAAISYPRSAAGPRPRSRSRATAATWLWSCCPSRRRSPWRRSSRSWTGAISTGRAGTASSPTSWCRAATRGATGGADRDSCCATR